MTQPLIRVRGLEKTFVVPRKEPGLWGSVRALWRREYVEKRAVRGVSFEVGEGEIVGLVGANGAGKTTVAKMLAGIVVPTAGEAEVLGYTPWERQDAFRRQIALIMGQKAQLWWDLPAADSFLLLREIYRIPRERFQRTVAELARRLDVEDQLTVQVRRLSLGERMKLELIAALLHQPRVVFLDEPTIGLDLATQRAVREFLLEVQAEQRPAMVLTSHYMEDIERLCRRLLILREGELVYDGTLQEVKERYADRKVITAHLRECEAAEVERAASEVGTLKERTRETVRVEVARGEVAGAAARLLEALPVVDLSIDEVEIGEVIAQIQAARGAAVDV